MHWKNGRTFLYQKVKAEWASEICDSLTLQCWASKDGIETDVFVRILVGNLEEDQWAWAPEKMEFVQSDQLTICCVRRHKARKT